MDEEQLREVARQTDPQPAEPARSEPAAPDRQSATDRALDDATDDAIGRRPPAANPHELTDEEIAHAAVLEQMAHGMTYRGEETGDVVSHAAGPEESDHRDMLLRNGYDPEPQLITGENGMEMVVFRPVREGVAPVVSFRGTEGVDDVRSDVNPDAVGEDQYAANEELITSTMAQISEEYGPIEVTGHSLGGALAQRAAARNPETAGHITTFQSPGIDEEDVALIEQHNAERIANGQAPLEADHFRVDNDVVPWAGEAHAPGSLHQMTLNEPADDSVTSAALEPVRAHQAMPVTALAMQTEAGQNALGPLVRAPEHDRVVATASSDVEEADAPWRPVRSTLEETRSAVGRGADQLEWAGDQQLAHTDRVLELGNARVDGVQRVAGQAARGVDRRVGAVERQAEQLARRGQRSVDEGQDEVARSVSQGQAMVDELQESGQTFGVDPLIDVGQDLANSGVSTAQDAVDRGQQLAEDAGSTVHETVDSGRQLARTALHRGQQVVDRGQRVVSSGQRAVHDAWDWVTS